MLEERLTEIDLEINSLNMQIFSIRKDGLQISNGLKEAQFNLNIKRDNILTNIDLWKIMLKVYPNYDR